MLLAWPSSSSLTHCHSAKDVGDREIVETYLNSASKNTSEIDIFPYGTKSLLTSVMCKAEARLIYYVFSGKTALWIEVRSLPLGCGRVY